MLSDIGIVFNFLKFDLICIQENTHQCNWTIHFILLSYHRMAAKCAGIENVCFKKSNK